MTAKRTDIADTQKGAQGIHDCCAPKIQPNPTRQQIRCNYRRVLRRSSKNDSMSSRLTAFPDSARAWSMTFNLSLLCQHGKDRTAYFMF